MSEQRPCVSSTMRVLGETAQHQISYRFGDYIDRCGAAFMLDQELGHAVGVEGRRAAEQPPTAGCPESEIDQPNPAGRRDDHVLRFDVPVRQACLMAGG